MTKPGVIKAKNGKVAQQAQIQVMRAEANKLPAGFSSIFESLAKDKFYHRNYFFDCLATAFPYEKTMWYTDRYYPYAECGPLAIDDGGHTDDLQTIKLKKQHLEKSGIKYVLLEPNMDEMTAREQLA